MQWIPFPRQTVVIPGASPPGAPWSSVTADEGSIWALASSWAAEKNSGGEVRLNYCRYLPPACPRSILLGVVPAAGGAPRPQIGESCAPVQALGKGPSQPQSGSRAQLGEGKAGLAVGTGHLETFGERSEKGNRRFVLWKFRRLGQGRCSRRLGCLL